MADQRINAVQRHDGIMEDGEESAEDLKEFPITSYTGIELFTTTTT